MLRVLAHSNVWVPLFARYLPQSHAHFVTNSAREMQLCRHTHYYERTVRAGRSQLTIKNHRTKVMDLESSLAYCSGMEKWLWFKLCRGLGPQGVDPITLRYFNIWNFIEIIDNSSRGKVSK